MGTSGTFGRAFGDASDEADRAVQRRPCLERRLRGALERRAVRERVGVRQPDLEHVGPGVDRRNRDLERARRRSGSPRRCTGSAPFDARRPPCERSADGAGADGVTSCRSSAAGQAAANRRLPSWSCVRLAPSTRTARGPCRRARRSRAAPAPRRDTASPRPSVPARRRGSAAIAWAVSRAGRIPSVSAVKAIASKASSSVDAASSMRPAWWSADSCGPTPG